MDVLVMRGRREPCHARQVPTARIDALVWDDLRQLLSDPDILQDAVQRFRDGWLSGEERQAQRRDLRRRRAPLQRRIERLVDAYQAEALTSRNSSIAAHSSKRDSQRSRARSKRA